MKKRGFEEGPFQLLINVIVLGMALTLGYYLYDNVQCFQCNTRFDNEILTLRETIATVGKGDVGTRKHDFVRVEEIGSCAKALYLRKLTNEENFKCEKFCPEHPNNCWVIFATRRCGDKMNPVPDCIDISGDTNIESEILPIMTTGNGDIFDTSRYISSSRPLSIVKTGVNEITITNY